MRTKRLLKGLVTGIAVVTAAAALAGCSDDDSDSSSSTTSGSGKQAVCDARDKLETSVQDLTDPSLLTSGKSGIQSALDDTKQDLDDLGSAAKETYDPQIDAVKTSITGLQDAIGDAGDGSFSDSLQDIGNAISDVGAATDALATKLRADCPS
jgi:gas vesicle protein